MEIVEIDSLPPLVRGGGRKTSAEVKQIQEALQTGKACALQNVPAGKEYSALQQRIRSAATKIGLEVTIRYDKETQVLSFQEKNAATKAEEAKKNGQKDSAQTSTSGRTKTSASK